MVVMRSLLHEGAVAAGARRVVPNPHVRATGAGAASCWPGLRAPRGGSPFRPGERGPRSLFASRSAAPPPVIRENQNVSASAQLTQPASSARMSDSHRQQPRKRRSGPRRPIVLPPVHPAQADGSEAPASLLMGWLRQALFALSEEDRMVASMRNPLSGGKPVSYQSIGALHCKTGEWARRRWGLIASKLRPPLVDEWVEHLGAAIRAELGAFAAVRACDQTAARLLHISADHKEQAAALALRWVQEAAGYKPISADWLAHPASGIHHVVDSADSCADKAGLIDEAALQKASPSPEAWANFRRLEEAGGSPLPRVSGYLARRRSAAARAKAALLRLGGPATLHEIAAFLNNDRVDGEKLMLQSRVWDILEGVSGGGKVKVVRTDKRRWALAETYDGPEFHGTIAEIVNCIQRSGGSVDAGAAADYVASTFDVLPSSVWSYMRGGAEFVLEGDGTVRQRTPEDEPYSLSNPYPMSRLKGAFALSGGRVALLTTADYDLLRGSGRSLPMTLAQMIGLEPGRKAQYSGPNDLTVNMEWHPHRPAASMSSLRRLAESAGARRGDAFTIIWDPRQESVSVSAVNPDDYAPGWDLVGRLSGIDAASGMSGLASAVRCHRGEVLDVLRRRGDHALADIVAACVSDLREGVGQPPS